MRQHYTALDGLRGLAAVAVMLMHEIGIFRPGLGPQIHASIAVDLFFILSGFVLAHAYDRRLDEGMRWTKFMMVRLIRLYPMLALATSLSVGLAVLKSLVQHISTRGESLWLAPAGLLLLPTGLFMGQSGAFSSQFDLIPFGGPAWSLLFELIASAIFATHLRRPGNSGVLLFALGVVALIVLTVSAGRIGLLGTQGYIGIPGGLVRVGISFIIGVTLFRRRIPDMLPQSFAGLAIAAGALLCALPISGSPMFDLACVFLFFPIVICLGAHPVRSARLDRACSLLGALSYPLYLLHVPVSRMIGFIAKAAIPSMSANVLIVLAAIGSVVASFLALYLFDEPVRRWLTARLRRNTPLAPTLPITGELPFEHNSRE
jgi:peptidoglycan/LPS O-acetylase OafA/YrhL